VERGEQVAEVGVGGALVAEEEGEAGVDGGGEGGEGVGVGAGELVQGFGEVPGGEGLGAGEAGDGDGELLNEDGVNRVGGLVVIHKGLVEAGEIGWILTRKDGIGGGESGGHKLLLRPLIGARRGAKATSGPGGRMAGRRGLRLDP
jgi:hypothetical protein